MSGWLLFGFILAAFAVGASPAAVFVTGLVVFVLSLAMDR